MIDDQQIIKDREEGGGQEPRWKIPERGRLSPSDLPPDLLGQTEGRTDLGYGGKKGAPDKAGRNAVRRGAGERNKRERSGWGESEECSLSANQEPSAAP